MHYKKRNRLITIIAVLVLSSIGAYIILSNLRNNIVYFYPPSELRIIKNKNIKVRVGGLVKPDSVKEIGKNITEFMLTDDLEEINVIFKGVLPALFREKQGVIAEGKITSDKKFIATKLLVKHDETYMPPALSKVVTK